MLLYCLARIALRVAFHSPLAMLPVCMNCHGTADQISESVRSQLAHDYPHDRAIGLTVGKVRGAVTYKKPL